MIHDWSINRTFAKHLSTPDLYRPGYCWTRCIRLAVIAGAILCGQVFASGEREVLPEIDYPPDQIVSLWPIDQPADRNSSTKRRGNVTRIERETWPSLEVYLPDNHSITDQGPGILIFPGGAYAILAYDLEGTEIARWLNQQGIVAAVVRYSVPGQREQAFADSQRAISVFRSRASEFGFSPQKLGLMGFSAGGHLVARLASNTELRQYPDQDDADNSALRPDFVALLYPAYMSPRDEVVLRPTISVTSNNPPAFIAHALDDKKKYLNSSLAYHQALLQHNIDVEIHLFESGGHGFGLRADPDLPVSGWPDLFLRWLNRLPDNS